MFTHHITRLPLSVSSDAAFSRPDRHSPLVLTPHFPDPTATLLCYNHPGSDVCTNLITFHKTTPHYNFHLYSSKLLK